MKLSTIFRWILPIGLLRLSFSSDSTTTQLQTTTQSDNRNILGNGAVQAQHGSSVGITNTTTTNNTTLDASVANAAIHAATDTAVINLQNSLNFGSDALFSAFKFGGKSLAANTDALDRSFKFGGDSLSSAFSFGGKSLDYAAKANAQVLDSLSSTETLVSNAYADAKGRGALTDKILIGAIAMAGLVAFAAVRGK